MLEAEITGGLEHPGVVPVYGLGVYEDGQPYYAMRFIRGESMQDAIEALHQRIPFFDAHLASDGQRLFDLRKLLSRFIDVCQAIGYGRPREAGSRLPQRDVTARHRTRRARQRRSAHRLGWRLR